VPRRKNCHHLRAQRVGQVVVETPQTRHGGDHGADVGRGGVDVLQLCRERWNAELLGDQNQAQRRQEREYDQVGFRAGFPEAGEHIEQRRPGGGERALDEAQEVGPGFGSLAAGLALKRAVWITSDREQLQPVGADQAFERDVRRQAHLVAGGLDPGGERHVRFHVASRTDGQDRQPGQHFKRGADCGDSVGRRPPGTAADVFLRLVLS
jgi:hypothetical protein